MDFWNWLINFLKDTIFNYLGLNLLLDESKGGWSNVQGWFTLICNGLIALITLFIAYRTIYMFVGIFAKPRSYKTAPKDKRYAYVLCARNEEAVIGNLIESIRAMDYPQELIDIYLVADNCSENDKTAEIGRSLGAFVYERHDPSKARKGYALKWFFNEIKKEFEIDKKYDGYVFMDADNICAPKFMEKMNDAFQSGLDVVTGYRNVKNIEENWLSAIMGISMYRGLIIIFIPRSLLNSCQTFGGTGFLMDSKLLKDGWNATGLTEDMETVIDLASKNKKIGYASEAEFYDEQPTNFRIHVRQRIRWSRGFINVWAKDSWKLIASFFKKPSWSKYDLFWDIFPYSLVTFILQWVNTFAGLGVLIATQNVDVSILISTFVVPFIFSYIIGIIQGIVIVVKEWKKIHLNFWQAVGYLLLWPINDIIGMPIALISLFMKVTWKPIPHHVVKDATVMVEEEERKGRKNKEKKHV